MNPDAETIAWSILSGVLVALIVFLVFNRINKAGKIPRRSKFLFTALSAAVFLVGVAGVWLTVLWSSGPPASVPKVKFPSTGLGPTTHALVESITSGRPTSIEILITLFLLVPIVVLATTAFRSISVRKRVEKDLEDAKIAALNVLEDLQVEKETLAYEKAKDDAMLAAIGDGVIIVDPLGQITFMNPPAQTLLGWDSAEVIGKSLSDFIPIEDEQGMQIPPKARPIAIALATGITTAGQVRGAAAPMNTTTPGIYYYTRKDTTKFPVAMTFSPVILQNKVVGAIEVFRDITKERDIDRAKTEFVSLASHQLRTPLSAVRWYSEMLLEGDAGIVSEKQRRYLEEIQHGNLRMIELVNTLLHVSQLELGTAELHVESIQLTTVIREVLRDLELRRRVKAVSVQVDSPRPLAPLASDLKLLRIVIENLISNAMKYSQTGGTVRVVVQEVSAGASFAARVAGEQSIGVSVIDKGIGIPLAQQDQIFKKLFRAENAREIDTDGTGLGLYLTRLVLGRLMGQIWFTSKAGEGTTFSVLLPYAALAPQPV